MSPPTCPQRAEHAGLDMRLVITGSGMKAYTAEQGLTEYRAHRISYCIAHPDFPKLFVWVYRHEGRKMKMELRCHAVLCKTEAKAKAMALQLHEKLTFALKEFQREKIRKQNSRLVLQRTNSAPNTSGGSVLPLRTQLLSTATNFRPPVHKSNTAPKLGAITEDAEEMAEEEEEGLEEEVTATVAPATASMPGTPHSAGPSAASLVHGGRQHHDILEALNLQGGLTFTARGDGRGDGDLELGDLDPATPPPVIDLEVGNDLDALRRDGGVRCCLEPGDSDEESAESGFHDQDTGLLEDEAPPPQPGDVTGGHDVTEDVVGEVCPLPSAGADLTEAGAIIHEEEGEDFVEQTSSVSLVTEDTSL